MDYHFLLLNVNSHFIEKKSPHYIVCGICGGLNPNTMNQDKKIMKNFCLFVLAKLTVRKYEKITTAN